MRHIISLSSIPPRFDGVGETLASLLRQTSRPEAVELYIPKCYRRFPQWGGGLPEVPDGVKIVRVEEDLGPATKILPAARAYRGQDVNLIYLDDDIVLADDWAERCLTLRKAHPGSAICGSGYNIQKRFGYSFAEHPLPRAIRDPRPHDSLIFRLRRFLRQTKGSKSHPAGLQPYIGRFQQSGYIEIAQGFGGVMVRPEFFDDLDYHLPPVVWSVDDIWLSGQLTRKGIPIWVDRSLSMVFMVTGTSSKFPLLKAVLDGADREAANRACIEHMRETYGIWGGAAVPAV